MKTFLVLAFLCIAICEIYADDTLECYQCSPVTQECEVDKAASIKCGSTKNSRCLKQFKKGTADESKAIRKCGVPDSAGKISCPNDYSCFDCDSDFCNGGSMMKFTWTGLVSVFLAILYIH